MSLSPYQILKDELRAIEKKIKRLQFTYNHKSESLKSNYNQRTGLRYSDASPTQYDNSK